MKARIVDVKRGILLAAAVLLAGSCWVEAQTGPTSEKAQNAAPKAVALVSDACPAVQRGGRIALDWNPNFDNEGEVSGLHSFEMIFRKLDEYGVNVMEKGLMFTASTMHTAGAITPLGNGFYHIELTVARDARPGVYRLVVARASAEVYPEYKNIPPWPAMTDSPVRTRLCVTVLPPPSTEAATASR